MSILLSLFIPERSEPAKSRYVVIVLMSGVDEWCCWMCIGSVLHDIFKIVVLSFIRSFTIFHVFKIVLQPTLHKA